MMNLESGIGLKRRLAACVTLLCLPAFLPGAVFGVPLPNRENLPFSPGEKLGYNVSWNGLSGGQVFFTFLEDVLEKNERVFKVEVDTTTGGTLGRFYPFRARMRSFFSETFVPFRSDYDARDVKGTRTERTSYDSRKSRAQWVSRREKQDIVTERDAEFAVPPFFLDPLSLMYYLRAVDLSVGDEIRNLPIIVDRKEFTARITVAEKQNLRVMGRVIPTFRLVANGFQKNDPKRDFRSVWIWVSADGRRLPVRISARVPLGVATAALVDYSPGLDNRK